MEGSSCKKLKKLSKCLALVANSCHRANNRKAANRANNSKAVDRACHNNNRALVGNKAYLNNNRACHNSRDLVNNNKVYRANSSHR